jgi:hypothetical protein
MQTTGVWNLAQDSKMRVEKRRSRRAALARPMRVRPSGPEDAAFEDTPISVNASGEGVYFTTRRKSYYPGMQLVLTFPFIAPSDVMNSDYLGQVARVEELANGRFGIGVQLLIDVTRGAAAGPPARRLA